MKRRPSDLQTPAVRAGENAPPPVQIRNGVEKWTALPVSFPLGYMKVLQAHVEKLNRERGSREEAATVESFMWDCVSRELNRATFPGWPMGNLEQAVNEALGLLEMCRVAYGATLIEKDGHSATAQTQASGIDTITRRVTEQMRAAFKLVWDYSYGKEPHGLPALASRAG